MKYQIPNDDLSQFDQYDAMVDQAVASVAAAYQ